MLSTVPSTKDGTSNTASIRERSLSQNNYNKSIEKVIEDGSNDIINKVEIIDGDESTTEKMVNSFNEIMFRPSRENIDSLKYKS